MRDDVQVSWRAAFWSIPCFKCVCWQNGRRRKTECVFTGSPSNIAVQHADGRGMPPWRALFDYVNCRHSAPHRNALYIVDMVRLHLGVLCWMCVRRPRADQNLPKHWVSTNISHIALSTCGIREVLFDRVPEDCGTYRAKFLLLAFFLEKRSAFSERRFCCLCRFTG